MDWLKELVSAPSSAQVVNAWVGMMSTPSEKQLQCQVKFISVLQEVSPNCNVMLETDNVTTYWDDQRKTVRLFLHFKGTHEKYFFSRRY